MITAKYICIGFFLFILIVIVFGIIETIKKKILLNKVENNPRSYGISKNKKFIIKYRWGDPRTYNVCIDDIKDNIVYYTEYHNRAHHNSIEHKSCSIKQFYKYFILLEIVLPDKYDFPETSD